MTPEPSPQEEIDRLASWAEVIDDSTYYEILGVLELADGAAIRAAFHEFALAFHPDQHLAGSDLERRVAEYVFRRGAEAYRILSDPALRPQYDLAVARGSLRLIGGVASKPAAGALKLQTLEDICKSPAARLAARRADECIGRNDLGGARRLLREALTHDEYDNAALEERIEALDMMLFASGD
jgi:curved DNA-binding protein CbpA